MSGRARRVLHLRLALPRTEGGDPVYGQVLEALHDVTPVIQPIPPDGADLDVTGVLRLWDRDVRGVGMLVQLRLAGLFGMGRTAIGAGGNRMIAAMAAAVTPPGAVTVVGSSPDAVAAFLRPQPVAALPGVGPATARTLRRLGLHTVGALADLPTETLQRIVGASATRGLHERANGHDPRPVTPQALPGAITRDHRFAADELDPARHRAALIALAETIGARLRTGGQVAGALALTFRYADGSASVRRRVLDEPTAHSPALTRGAYELYERLGLQRARVRGIRLRAEQLRPDEEAVRQLTLDPADDRARAVEAAADRARARFGPAAVMPAALAPLPEGPAPSG